MKCEHCTRKECSKKSKTEDPENVSAASPGPARPAGEKGEFHRLADAKIFLSDCLACDSCVTAEEGVQLSQQNAADFLRVVNLNKKCDVSKHKVLAVSVCPQSLPFFAAKFNLSVQDASRRLCGFLKSLEIMRETKRSACLLVHPQMADGRARPGASSRSPTEWPAPTRGRSPSASQCAGMRVGSSSSCHNTSSKERRSPGVHYVFDTAIAADLSILESQKEFVRRYQQHSQDGCALPMLTSACPGWVRYAERVLGHPVTPHLCTAKSPQQVMGSLVKDYFARQKNLSPEKIFHVIVAPCYDKKLEALQEVPPAATPGCRGVDCVLTSGEIAQIMEQSDLSVTDAAVDTLFGHCEAEAVRCHDGAGSDGYLAHVFRHAAKELFGEHVEEVTYRALRNRDFREVTLERNGEVLLRFAAAYGFRNIQNMVLKLRKGRFPYHFVEVLACPRGCLNGRGQAYSEDGQADKALLRQMEGMSPGLPVRPTEASRPMQALYQEWLDGSDSPKAQQTLHTSFLSPSGHTDGLDIKW